MSDRSIGNQIQSISLMLTGGLLLLATISLSATLLIRSTFIEYRETARSTLDAVGIFEDLFEARLAALKWRVTQGADSVEEFYGNVAEVHELEEQLAAARTSVMFSEALEQLHSDITEYASQFEGMTEAQIVYNRLDDEIAETGTGIRRLLTEIMDSAYLDDDPTAAYYAGKAQESLMLGRFYIERFRKTESADHLNIGTGHIQQAEKALQTLVPELQNPRRLQLANTALADLDSYAENVNLLSSTMNLRIDARGRMDALGPQMVHDVEVALDQIIDRQNTLGPRGQSVAFWTVVIIAIACSVVVSVGWFMARRRTSSIVGNIEESVDVMSRIAEGDLEVEVKNVDQENELGRMARALDVFKTNGKAAIEAAEREKTMEQERLAAENARKKQQEEQDEAARAKAEADRKEMIASLSASLGTVVSAASDGDFSKRVDAQFDDEELTGLAKEVNALVENVDHGLAAAGRALERVAKGDLTENMQGEFHGAFANLQDNTNDMIAALRSLIKEITGSGANLASSSEELRDTSDVLSRQAEQNAASLEQTSAALEQLSASIKQVSSSVSDASDNARVASDTAKSSGQVAADAADSMNRISDASKEITQVVGVINDIAFQINLLALNAGVEAARAGEAGRGFSVVASEVRLLAQRASEAAKEIDAVIVRSDEAVSEGVAKVGDAQSSLAAISKSVVSISGRVDEISSAISEQVHGVSEISNAVSQIDQNTQKQAASFEEVTAASSLLANEAGALKQSTAHFKTDQESKVVELTQKPTVRKTSESALRVAVAAGAPIASNDGWDEF